MTKHGKGLPLRRQRDGVEDALLIRSAESLGRMIGSLQRQLEGASKKFSAAEAMKFFGADGDGHTSDGHKGAGHKSDGHKARSAGGAVKESRRMTRNGQAKGGSKSGVTKVRSTADRKSKRAAKSATTKKTAGRSRSGASRKASKSSRSR
jgi:hypothetical protein